MKHFNPKLMAAKIPLAASTTADNIDYQISFGAGKNKFPASICISSPAGSYRKL